MSITTSTFPTTMKKSEKSASENKKPEKKIFGEGDLLGGTLKNFFGNLLYVFVPMGIFYLFLLVAIFGFAGAAFGSLGGAFTSIASLISSATEESGISVSEFLTHAAGEIDWGRNFFAIVAQILDTRWISRTVASFIELLGVSSENFNAELSAITGKLSEELHLAFSVAAVWISLGLLLANYVTLFFLRRKSARRSLSMWIVAATVLPVFQTLVLIGTVALAALVQYYSLLVAFAYLFAHGFFCLLSAWILHGRNKLPFKQVVNGKNILLYFASVGAIGLIVLAAFFLLAAFNDLLALLVLIPLCLYAINIVSVGADAYVASLAKKAEPASAEERP